MFFCKYKSSKSNTKISVHYRIICLYSENNCFNVFIVNALISFGVCSTPKESK